MWETCFIILNVVIIILVLCFIPLFWQIWRAAKNMATALAELNRSLPRILKNLEDITTDINSATRILCREAESLSLLGNKVRGILALGEDVEQILSREVKIPLLEIFKTCRGIMKGMGAFMDALFSKSGES